MVHVVSGLVPLVREILRAVLEDKIRLTWKQNCIDVAIDYYHMPCMERQPRGKSALLF